MSQIGSSAVLAESAGWSTALSPKTATTALTTSSVVARSALTAGAVTVATTGADVAATGVDEVTGATDAARTHAPVANNSRTGAEWKGSFTRGT